MTKSLAIYMRADTSLQRALDVNKNYLKLLLKIRLANGVHSKDKIHSLTEREIKEPPC